MPAVAPQESGGLSLKTTAELLALHNRAGPLQYNVLSRYPGAPDTLPMPFRDDLEYFDGAQFFLLDITNSLEQAGYESVLSEAEHVLLNTTNGLNDWWMDESDFGEGEGRDYGRVIEIFDGINGACYSYLGESDAEKTSVTTVTPEVQRVIDYYDYVLSQMPREHRASLAKLLISINFYQGISLYQERGFREHLGLEGLALNGRDISEEDLEMLHRMRIEKGGFMLLYPWPYFPEITDGIVIPDESPTITGVIENFLRGNSLYPEDGIARHLLEVGGVLQLMDDSCDRTLDWERSVVSPENVGVAYAMRSNESWGDMAERILRELKTLRDPDYGEHYEITMDAATSAVAGLTLYRATKYGSVAS